VSEALFCLDGGATVGGEGDVPLEAWDARRVPGLAWGCNHLVCRKCGVGVVQRAGVRVASSAIDRPAVFAAGDAGWEDARAKGWLEADPRWRTYLCRCHSWSDDRTRGLQVDDDFDSFLGEFAPPWACAGHPRTSSVDGVAIGVEPSWVADALGGSRGLKGPAAAEPGAWVARVIGLLDGVDLSRVGAALADALRSPLAEVRSQSADVFRLWPELPGAERVAEVLAEWSVGYRNVADPLRPRRFLDQPLQDVLGFRLIAKVAGPDEVALAASLLTMGYSPTDFLARGLALEAPTALAAGIDAILGMTPTAIMVARLVAAGTRADNPALDDALVAAARGGLGPLSAWHVAARGLARGTLQARLLAAGS